MLGSVGNFAWVFSMRAWASDILAFLWCSGCMSWLTVGQLWFDVHWRFCVFSLVGFLRLGYDYC